jgi:hypothetical protein
MELNEAQADPRNPSTSVRRLKQEIDELTLQQSDALKSAIYVGMTPDEAKDYDARRSRIMQLAEQLRHIGGSL